MFMTISYCLNYMSTLFSFSPFHCVCRCCGVFFLANWRFPATLFQSSLSAPFFPMSFSYFMSVSYFSSSHNISNFLIYYYICYDLWSLISDVPIVIIWGMHKLHPYKTVNFIRQWVFWLTVLPTNHPLCLLSPGAVLVSETQQHWNLAN